MSFCGSLASSFCCYTKRDSAEKLGRNPDKLYFIFFSAPLEPYLPYELCCGERRTKVENVCVNGYFANSCMAIIYCTTGTQVHLCIGEKIKTFNVSGHFNCNSLLRIGLNMMYKWQFKYCLTCCKLENRYKGSYYF